MKCKNLVSLFGIILISITLFSQQDWIEGNSFIVNSDKIIGFQKTASKDTLTFNTPSNYILNPFNTDFIILVYHKTTKPFEFDSSIYKLGYNIHLFILKNLLTNTDSIEVDDKKYKLKDTMINNVKYLYLKGDSMKLTKEGVNFYEANEAPSKHELMKLKTETAKEEVIHITLGDVIKKHYPDYNNYELYLRNKLLIIFLNGNMEPVNGVIPIGCLEKELVEAVQFVIVDSTDTNFEMIYNNYSSFGSMFYSTFPTGTTDFNAISTDKDQKKEEIMKRFSLKKSNIFNLRGNWNQFLIKPSEGGSSLKNRLYSVSLCTKIMVSAQLGMYYSKLSDPDNLRLNSLSNGKKVISADHVGGGMKAAVSATFYFKPRDIYHLNKLDFWERWSANVGLGIGDDLITDYFFGLDMDIGWGLKISGGRNVSKVTRLIGYPDGYEFNVEDYIFDEIEDFQKWSSDWYFGVTIDARIILNLLGARRNQKLNQAFIPQEISTGNDGANQGIENPNP